MPIRARLSDYTARLKLKQKASQLHPLLGFGTKHHAVWHTLVEAGRKGMTAYQLKQAESNYHPQILADLVANKLVNKLGKSADGQFRYTADPKGKGVLTQQVNVKIELYETGNGELVTRTIVQGIRGRPDKVIKKLAERTVSFVIPTKDGKWTIPVDPDEIVVDDIRGYQPAAEAQAMGRAIRMLQAPKDPSACIIDVDYSIMQK